MTVFSREQISRLLTTEDAPDSSEMLRVIETAEWLYAQLDTALANLAAEKARAALAADNELTLVKAYIATLRCIPCCFEVAKALDGKAHRKISLPTFADGRMYEPRTVLTETSGDDHDGE